MRHFQVLLVVMEWYKFSSSLTKDIEMVPLILLPFLVRSLPKEFRATLFGGWAQGSGQDEGASSGSVASVVGHRSQVRWSRQCRGTPRDWPEYHFHWKKQGLFGPTAHFSAGSEKDKQGLSDCASQWGIALRVMGTCQIPQNLMWRVPSANSRTIAVSKQVKLGTNWM